MLISSVILVFVSFSSYPSVKNTAPTSVFTNNTHWFLSQISLIKINQVKLPDRSKKEVYRIHRSIFNSQQIEVAKPKTQCQVSETLKMQSKIKLKSKLKEELLSYVLDTTSEALQNSGGKQ